MSRVLMEVCRFERKEVKRDMSVPPRPVMQRIAPISFHLDCTSVVGLAVEPRQVLAMVVWVFDSQPSLGIV